MTKIRKDLIEKLWKNQDPFAQWYQRMDEDVQGWNSDHQFLTNAVIAQPGLAIDVGVWKGASTITMAKTMKRFHLNSCVLSVDHFCGSAEHWLDGALPRKASNGRSTLYELFGSNVLNNELWDYVVPLPLDTCAAVEVLTKHKISASVIHLDTGHGGNQTLDELDRWWPLLQINGIFLIDDYGNSSWPEVKKDVDTFLGAKILDAKVEGNKLWFKKLQ